MQLSTASSCRIPSCQGQRFQLKALVVNRAEPGEAAPADGSAADAPAGSGAAADAQQQAQAVQLTASLQSGFSPRFQPFEQEGGSSRLVFLSQQSACESGVHNGTTSVHSLQWANVSTHSHFPPF